MKKAELLSPAGNFNALKGAIKAGADAVYLGGELYGARAYADNFTQEEICAGIHLAHVFGRKVYLTVNTLVKEKELDRLYHFLLPFYECGLDGVIIQDLGVLRYIREHFPHLELHASTQMTLTGKRGTCLVKEEGVSRIVPARELSLAEMKNIRENTGVEIEAFIHGAMCYCYSGQCLFSSILGGRSGNRGRCAQPCRLPYEADAGKSCYPLSMRDMCTVELLPELIEAGIDSFKIEGRMKKPAYAAGVTAIYRKYIDLYYQDKENYRVSDEDRKLLKSLYIRSEIGDGYYFKSNGREMITLSSPAYSETDEKLLSSIEKKYINDMLQQSVSAKIQLTVGEPSLLTLEKEGLSVACTGDVVQEALKQPLTEEKIKEQIKKSGNSLLKIEQVEIETDGAVFMPVRALNELRRLSAAAMEKEIIRRNGLAYEDRKAIPPTEIKRTQAAKKETENEKRRVLHVSVRTGEQLEAALKEKTERIYLDYSLIKEDTIEKLDSYRKNNCQEKTEFYIAAPYIVREKNLVYLEEIKKALLHDMFDGVLVRNLESLQYFIKENTQRKIVLDTNLYIWNREAVNFFQDRAVEFYLPQECNKHEWQELLAVNRDKKMRASAVVYGRLPMMITANCVRKTMGKCSKTPETVMLKDRYGKQFPVYTDCLCCYNVIYNSVPLSLHKIFSEKEFFDGSLRLDFTTEDFNETVKVMSYFKEISENYREPFYKDYTTGHYKRGVE